MTALKALVGGLVAAIAFAIPVVDDGLAPSEVLGIAGALLAGSGLVYVAPNKPAETRNDAEYGSGF